MEELSAFKKIIQYEKKQASHYQPLRSVFLMEKLTFPDHSKLWMALFRGSLFPLVIYTFQCLLVLQNDILSTKGVDYSDLIWEALREYDSFVLFVYA